MKPRSTQIKNTGLPVLLMAFLFMTPALSFSQDGQNKNGKQHNEAIRAIQAASVASDLELSNKNQKKLSESHGVFNRFVPKNMVVSLPGATYHAGAIKYYKERGWWPPAE